MLSLGRSRANAKHTGFRGFLWVGSSCWEEVTLFHCKNCAFIRSKPRYCQTHWFQRFFCGLAHHVGKRWPSFIARAVLSVGRSRTIAKHTGFRGFFVGWLIMLEEVTLFHCKSCAFIRSKPRYCQTHWFRGFLWVGSSCWEEVTDSLSFPHEILMVYHLISILSP